MSSQFENTPLDTLRFQLRPLAVLLILLSPGQAARAERPSAMKLFPEETVVFIRAANAHDSGEKLRQSNMGRMLQDPELKPFVEALWGKAGELYSQEVEGRFGLSWDEIKRLPKGEVAFGVVARKERRPALVLLVDQGDEASVADKLVDKALDFAQQQGADFSTEKFGEVEVTIVRDKDRANRMFGVFQRENTIVVATDADVIRNILHHWDHPIGAAGDAVSSESASADKTKADGAASEESQQEAAEFVPSRTLAENIRFATIVKQCRRPQDPPPQAVFYIDPIELMRNAGRGNAGWQLALGLFPSLGIDGIQAIGGTITRATDEYDTLNQFHVMLENPRSGILLLPAFQAGETSPQPFVPSTVASYVTWNLNLRTTYDRTVALVDQFRYQGSVDRFVKENMSDKIGIDVPTQVIDNLKGRYTWITGFDRPTIMQGDQHLFAVELNDENAGQESLKTVVDKFSDALEERHLGTVTYFAAKIPEPEDGAEVQVPYHPCVAITDGYLFISTSCQLLEQCIAARDGTAERLIDSTDYARTAPIIGREARGITPVMFSVTRMEETMRHWYEVLTSDRIRDALNENQDNPVASALADVMEQNKLPSFDVLAPYFGPSGGILFDTDSGYHAISFELRSEKKLEEAAATEPAAASN